MRSCETDFGQSYCKPASPFVALRIGSPQAASRSLLARALWSGGSGFAAQGSGRALASPRCTWWRPRYAHVQKNLVRASGLCCCASCFPPRNPKFPRAQASTGWPWMGHGHGILPGFGYGIYLPPPSGDIGHRASKPSHPGQTSRGRPRHTVHRAYFLGTRIRIKEAPQPRAACGRWSSSAPKSTTPTSQRLTPPPKQTGPGW
jgi:hypothetical protein